MSPITPGKPFAGNKRINEEVLNKDFGYEYPDGLDLHPRSEMHRKILDNVMTRIQYSYEFMSRRYPLWKKIDRNQTAFIPLDEEEKAIKNADERRPTAVVMPLSFAVREVILTYLTTTFLGESIFKYEGRGPEDVIGAAMLELLVKQQSDRAGHDLALHTQWNDAIKYGFGVIAPRWHRSVKQKTVVKQIERRGLFGGVVNEGSYRTREPILEWEGNVLDNVDPYRYYPDPNVPIHKPQEAEYVAWIDRSNKVGLIRDENRGDSGYFNARYLDGVGDGRSQFSFDEDGREDKFGGRSADNGGNVTWPLDVVHMYVTAIPREWGYGDSEEPEIRLITIAADNIIMRFSPLGLDHGMYPISVCAPDYDGYSLTPLGRLEVVYGLQEGADWYINSRMANVIKALNDVMVVDPFKVNLNDVLNPGPGGVIRLRREAWGTGLDGAIEQLKVNDVTQSHLQDITFIQDIMQRVTGAVDSLQGVIQPTGDRRSATEFRDTRIGAISRLAKMARIISSQSMRDLGYMMAAHTIQLLEEETYVRLIGGWERVFATEYGMGQDIQNGRIKVRPQSLAVDYDVRVFDDNTSGGEMAETWIQLQQMVNQDPRLYQSVDSVRVFLHIARLMGANNPHQFLIKTKPDEEIERGVQAGNMRPVEAAGGGNGFQS